MGKLLPDAYDPEVMPEVGELDELQTYVKKKHKIWLWTAVDHFRSGILGWVLGDRSSETFESLWDTVSAWKCYFYVTDGWPVHPMFIPDEDHIISKTYMTLLRRGKYEVETFRKQDYIARLFVIMACAEMLRHSITLLIHYLKFQDVPVLQYSYLDSATPNIFVFAKSGCSRQECLPRPHGATTGGLPLQELHK